MSLGKEVSNNTAEVAAILLALQMHGASCVILTDSMIAVHNFRNINTLARQNFAECSNDFLWRRIYLHKLQYPKTTVDHVKAHAGTLGNEMADRLAKFGTSWHIPNLSKFDLDESLASTIVNMSDEAAITRLAIMNPLPVEPHITKTSLLCRTDCALPNCTHDDAPSLAETQHAISMLRNGTAPGTEQIHHRSIKEGTILAPFHALLQSCWQHKKIPEAWKHSLLVNIPKTAGIPLGPENCRGISLLNATAKVLTRVILNRVPNAPTLPLQLGYNRARSSVHGIIVVQNTVQRANTANKPLFLLFVDISKAFDGIRRDLITTALCLYGFSETATTLIMQLYDDKCTLRYPDGSFSNVIAPLRGVKQGCIVSPIIFIVLLDLAIRNTLPHVTGIGLRNLHNDTRETATMLLYADDIVIFGKSTEDVQRALNTLSLQLATLNLRINVSKTKILCTQHLCAQDTEKGYADRCRKLNIHRDGHPLARYTHLCRETSTVTAPTGMFPLRCPLTNCPFVAVKGKTKPPHNALMLHLLQRHKLHVTMHKQEIVEAPSDTADAPRLHTKNTTPDEDEIASDITLYDTQVNKVSSFKYLGVIIDHTASFDKEICARVAKANQAFYMKNRAFWRAATIPLSMRMRIYRALVLPVLLYGSETWILTPSQISNVRTTYLTHLRIITHLNFTVTFVNGQLEYRAPQTSKILHEADAASMEDLIRQSRLRLAGQLYRQPVAPLTWGCMDIDNIKTPKRGTRCIGWIESVKTDMESLHLVPGDAENMGNWAKRIKPTIPSRL